MKSKKRTIAPRLLNGHKRITFGHGLPPEIKKIFKQIAKDKNKSMSWVFEEMVVDYYNLDKPRYVERKSTKNRK